MKSALRALPPDTPAAALNPTPSRWLDRLAQKAVHAMLGRLTQGMLTVIDESGSSTFGQRSADFPLTATVRVHDARFYSEVAFGGSIGAGEAFMSGYWSADDLAVVLRILLRNRRVLDGMDGGWARLRLPLLKALHWASRNSRDGSRRNIAAHYDLSNDFFRLFLDPTLMYSSAVFERPDMTLEEASIAKLDRLCRMLRLREGLHVLEIGTGWGGFAMHAARHYGCRVTTTTISQQQYDLAVERIAASGRADRITVLKQDYRDLTGRYDRIVSIEMIEAVGHQFYETFFGQCSALLEPDGMMALQAITIADQRYDAALRSVDFIQKHIFPGSCIPSVSAMAAAIARAGDMRIFELSDIGPHYAVTLNRWHQNVLKNYDAVRALGFPDAFVRLWEFYLCYCESGFAEHALGDVQMLLIKPLARPGPEYPAARATPTRQVS